MDFFLHADNEIVCTDYLYILPMYYYYNYFLNSVTIASNKACIHFILYLTFFVNKQKYILF